MTVDEAWKRLERRALLWTARTHTVSCTCSDCRVTRELEPDARTIVMALPIDRFVNAGGREIFCRAKPD